MFRIEQVRGATSDVERALDQIPRFQNSLCVDRADHDVDGVFLEALELSKLRDRQKFSINEKRVEALPLRPARDIGVKSFARFDEWGQNFEWAAFYRGLELFHDRGETLFLDRQVAIRTKLRSGFREKEPEKMINLGHGGNCRFAAAPRDPLLDRNARRHALDEINVRFFQLLNELPGVRRHAVQKA